jgi:hypothetical protein
MLTCAANTPLEPYARMRDTDFHVVSTASDVAGESSSVGDSSYAMYSAFACVQCAASE